MQRPAFSPGGFVAAGPTELAAPGLTVSGSSKSRLAADGGSGTALEPRGFGPRAERRTHDSSAVRLCSFDSASQAGILFARAPCRARRESSAVHRPRAKGGPVSDSEKSTGPTPATVSPKRFKTTGILACLMGVAAAVVGLVGVITGGLDLTDMLLFVGGLLLSVVGLRRLRQTRAR
jgi:hypothetical protein